MHGRSNILFYVKHILSHLPGVDTEIFSLRGWLGMMHCYYMHGLRNNLCCVTNTPQHRPGVDNVSFSQGGSLNLMHWFHVQVLRHNFCCVTIKYMTSQGWIQSLWVGWGDFLLYIATINREAKTWYLFWGNVQVYLPGVESAILSQGVTSHDPSLLYWFLKS